MQKVVLLGFKGDRSGKFYNKILIEKAIQRKIELICVDFGKPNNVLGVPTLLEMMKLIREKKVRYLDLQNPGDVKKYKTLSDINVVFIVTPDITHCEIARDFLNRTKKIFIEKPLDALLRNVKSLEGFPKIKKTVFGYDHYLGKFYPYQVQTDKWINEGIIGKIKEIEVRLLEPDTIPIHRISTLDTGAIYDLFSHSIAIVTAVPSKWAYPDPKLLSGVKILSVETAKYLGCQTKGASFAKIYFEISIEGENIPCLSRVGKGVGKVPDKILKVIGDKGEIFADIKKNNFVIFDKKGRKILEERLLPDFAESFFSSVIDFQKPLADIPGALPFESAEEILFILDEAEFRAEPKEMFPRYSIGSSFLEIEKIIKAKIKTERRTHQEINQLILKN